VLARDLDVLGEARDGELRIAFEARVQNFEVFTGGHGEPLQRLADVDPEEPKARGIQPVVLADDLVALEVDQVPEW
jgi:hypothetical protein